MRNVIVPIDKDDFKGRIICPNCNIAAEFALPLPQGAASMTCACGQVLLVGHDCALVAVMEENNDQGDPPGQ